MDGSKKYDNPNPELSASLFSKLVFWWLKPLFCHGKHHDLEIKDVYNVLPQDESKLLGDKLERNWIEEVRVAEEANRKPSFLTALRRTFAWSFAYYGGWQCFVSVVLRVLQPYFLGLFIWHFNPKATSSAAEAYAYASAIVIIAVLITFITQHASLGLMEVGMRVRVASSSLMYRKVLRLSQSSNLTTPGQIVNLLSNDVSKFELLFILLHYVWILPIQGALITFLIYESVQVASLAGVLLISIQTIPLQGLIGKWTLMLRSKIAVRTDERVRLMSEITAGIQVIKMYTWEKPFEKLVSLARSHEVDLLTLMSYLRGFTLATFVFTDRTTLYFTILAYVLLGHDISADKVFSMAQYFNILQLTMAIFYPIAVASAAEAAVSIKRIENFLLLKENTWPAQSQLRSDVTEKGSVTMKNVTASWVENVITNTLHDINIHVQSGKLYAVVGSVGAGKSSFLQLILRELRPSHGEIKLNGDIAYASQEPWLFSGTVRNNILFGQPYDKKKYNEVVKVCALTKDFQQLSHGEFTLVGDRGAALSGGQRARINLARAIYRSADIYLFDDPLSAVDTLVGRQLFDECINNYLHDKTRILVTHQVQYLKKCDLIIVLNNGKLEFEGTFAEFQSEHVSLLDMLKTEEVREDSESAEIEETQLEITTVSNNDVKNDEETEPEETEELMAKGNISRAVYWKYFRAGGSILMIAIFVFSLILGQIGSSGSDYWVAYWTKQVEIRIRAENDRKTESKNETSTFGPHYDKPNNGTAGTFLKITEDTYYLDSETALWIYGMLIAVSIVMTTVRNLVFYKICMNASKNLHNLMFSCLLKAPMVFFDKHPAGRILNRFSKDVGAVDEVLPKTLIESIQIFVVMIGILAQVLIINWWTLFPMLVMAFLYWEIRSVYLSTAQSMKRLEGVTKSPVFSHISSSLLGLTTIRSANATEMVRNEFDVHQNLHTGAYYLTIATATAFGFALDIVSCCFVAFITYSFLIFDNGAVFAGNVGLAVSQVLILCGMLQHGMRQTAEAMAQMTSVERILQYTQIENEGPFESEPTKKPPAIWPEKGEIKFDHLCLRYDDSAPPVLKDLCFAVKAGQKIGIAGRTGAGKTSLISALFHLTHIDGAIYIDNIDTKEVGLHDLRKKISIIPQEPILFSATLRDNLDPSHMYDDATLWSALENVELKPAIPSLDHYVNQGGSNFSVGQRQLLCLARAIIRNNKILLLDEATANVDHATDTLIQRTIRQNFKHCTVLTIAHRLNTIMDSDLVLVMDHGEAIEFDHPYVLLQNEQSHFTSMVKETGKHMFQQLKQISKEAYEKNSINMEYKPLPLNGATVPCNNK